MTNVLKGKRITFKHTLPNPLFQEWLSELYEEARTKKSKLEPILKEALSSLSKYPLPLCSGAECVILKGFDKRLCSFLDKRLEVYNSRNSVVTNITPDNAHTVEQSGHVSATASIYSSNIKSSPPTVDALLDNGLHNEVNKLFSNIKENRKKQTSHKYKPTVRSGGYAILIALLDHINDNFNNSEMTKEELIEKAQNYSEESFTRPKPESLYTAWSNMSRLIRKGLVQKRTNKKAFYSLTEQGLQLATELKKEAQNIPTINDIIFHNNDIMSRDNGIIDKNLATSVDDDRTVRDNYENDAIEMNVGTFDVVLLIDKNETSGFKKKNEPTVAQFNKYPDLKHEYRNLKVGDFTWIARHKINKDLEIVLPYIVERKRMDDLGASIKDGRYHEQKFRLRKCGLKNIIYLVESFGRNKHVGLPLQNLMQALVNTRVHDGFKVHMTESLTHSAMFLAMMTKRLTIQYQDKSLRGRNQEPKGEDLMTFSFFNKAACKTKALTVREAFIKMLLQLKGISVDKAVAITNKYPTPRILIEIYEKCDRKQGEMLLANLKYNERSRSVGPKISKTLYQLFTCYNEHMESL